MADAGRTAILGVGLIGGSLALALRGAGWRGPFVGYDRDQAACARARDAGVLDEVAQAPAAAVAGAHLVVLALPVRAIPPALAAIAAALPDEAVVTDVGSTKVDVAEAARSALGAKAARFVAGHPIAGREASGVEAARAELFGDARVVLCPDAGTAPGALATVRGMWEACGAQVSELTPARHDAILAAVSHLPHLLAFALVAEVAARDDAAELLAFAGGGFRDFTRIAAASPEMWRDVALQNRAALLAELDRYAASLAALRGLLDRGDGPGLERLMEASRSARRAWEAARRAEGA